MFVEWRFKGGALGGITPPPPPHPHPRRISQAHILTYAFQGYLASRYGHYSNGFDLCDGSKTKYKLISLY